MPITPFSAPETIPSPEDRYYDLFSHRRTEGEVAISNVILGLETMGSPILGDVSVADIFVQPNEVEQAVIDQAPMPVYPPDLN